jgi:glycosyltransferase involved in cell wall biosynthesis
MNRNLPLVSVVVPVYNVQDYIELSIKSICEQTYPNIEIIIVDDQSKDDSINKAKSVLEKYTVPYKIITEINKGLPGARNTGIFYSKGDYICFIDSDDYIISEHIEALVKIIQENDLEVAFSNYESVDIQHRTGINNSEQNNEIILQNSLLESFMKRKPAVHCCSLMIDTKMLNESKYCFNEKLRYGEDVEFMWKLFSRISKIGCTHINSYKYLIRKNSIMTTMTENSMEKGYTLIKELKNTLTKLTMEYPNNKDIYNLVYYRTQFGWLHVICRNSTYESFKNVLNHINKSELVKQLSYFPDWKIVILSYLLKINSYGFYLMIKRM